MNGKRTQRVHSIAYVCVCVFLQRENICPSRRGVGMNKTRVNQNKRWRKSAGVGVRKFSTGGPCMSAKDQCAIRQPLCWGIAHYLPPCRSCFCVWGKETERKIVCRCNPPLWLPNGHRVVKWIWDQSLDEVGTSWGWVKDRKSVAGGGYVQYVENVLQLNHHNHQ